MSSVDVLQEVDSHSPLNRFLVGVILGLVGLFAILRLPVVQEYVFSPWAAFLARAAVSTLHLLGQDVTTSNGIIYGAKQSLHVTEQCSGLEVIGVYLALTAVYPAPWLWRMGGMLWGFALFQLLNFARIIGLFWLENSPLFDLFHIYIWPLVLVGAGCVSWFAWVTWAQTSSSGKTASPPARLPLRRALLFVGTVGVLMLVRPFLIESPPMHLFAVAVTHGAANVLGWIGVPTQAVGLVVTSGSAAIRVGPGCAASPTLVLAIAAILSLPLSLKTRLLWFVFVFPLFYLLNVLRVVGVIEALLYWPTVWRWIEDYFLLTSLIMGLILGLGHLFTQGMELAQKQRFWLRLGLGVIGSISLWFLVGGLYGQALLWSYQQVLASLGVFPSELLPHNPERVLTALPVFQGIFFLAFAVSCQWRWKWLLAGGAGLYGSQLLCLLGVFFLSQSFGVPVHHYFVRGWIIAIPCGLIWRLTQSRGLAVRGYARDDNTQS
ncbi:MAG: archaeosortase/exosortase family protein [Candidatus Binatia bacterium]